MLLLRPHATMSPLGLPVGTTIGGSKQQNLIVEAKNTPNTRTMSVLWDLRPII